MRLLIVDDDAIVAQSLATILAAQSDIEVVGVGASGAEAVSLSAGTAVDIVLMDIRMPGMDGLAGAERILERDPDARIVFLTTFADDEYIVRALRMGARGYLIKQDIAQIAPALRSVMAGMSVLEGRVLERSILAAEHKPAGEENHGRAPVLGEHVDYADRPEIFSQLSEREWEIVEAVSQGMDNAEIADTVFMSVGTVRNHISAILAKLALKNRTQIAVAYFRAHGRR
ncbi:response regulator transcription factor [Schaalia cardiffensis]|uniref:response regulator transcription factor n=1 Tax=Schaalia cardiffensis TaxID=181487 RepID=UPI0023F3F73E|nr:response regulator transcription factor [Schaalia cardiffensis]